MFLDLRNIAFAETDSTKCERWQAAIERELKRNPGYKLGTTSFTPGDEGDCSLIPDRTLREAEAEVKDVTNKVRQIGIPVRRTNTSRMMAGLDGWDHVKISFEDAAICDMPFFKFKPKAKYNHTGVFTRKRVKETYGVFAHASSSKGFTQDDMQQGDYFYNHLICTIRLNRLAK